MMPTGARSTANSPAPPADLVERFAAALARLRPDGGRIGLAVSGGPDSMAMLLLAHAAIPGEFEVATVDHGLRPEAADECALVERVCRWRHIPCEALRVEVGERNLQARARGARYRALTAWAEQRGLTSIATAHHADDQAETLLMRLNRGSGVDGLAGVRERHAFLWSAVGAIRPLLGFRREELRVVVEAAGIDAADDPSNRDERFDRVRIRKALAEADWLDPIAIAQSATILADESRTLGLMASREWMEQVDQSEEEVRYRPRWTRTMKFRVVLHAIKLLGGQARGSDVARLLDRLEAGEGGNLAGVLATIEGNEWVFRPEPPRRTG